MKLGLDISVDLVAVMAAEIKAGERAVTAAMRDAGTDLKAAWRGQIAQAGLGRRLANSIRSQSYPRAGESLRAAALVWSKAPVIIGAHDTGPLIRSRDGFWLAIPLPAAGKSLRGGRMTPGEWERRRGLRLRFVYRRRGPRWDGCRPPQTASQCAKMVVLKATKRGGRQGERYNNWGGSGKASFPAPRGGDDW